MRFNDLIGFLHSLRQQTTWRRFELPNEFTDDVLERLFEDGFIQTHVWWREAGGLGKPGRISFGSMAGWICIGDSRRFGNAGPFRHILSDPSNQGDTAPEFQLSEKGWMALHDAENASAAVAGPHDTSRGVDSAADKLKGALAWLHEHYVAPLIVILIGAIVLAWIGLSP